MLFLHFFVLSLLPYFTWFVFFDSTNLGEIFVTAKYSNCFVFNILPFLTFFNFGIEGIVINNITNKIFIKDIEYSYEDIVDFNTHDNSQVVQSTKTTSTVKNDNGNVAGRALVGGILFGAVGAVVGASTAKKTTEQAVQTEVTNSTLHNYSIEIILNKAQPISKVIQLYDDETALSEISSTLTTIINQNKS